MKFSLLMDKQVLKEYFHIKKIYLSKQDNIAKMIPVILIFIILIGIIFKWPKIDATLKGFAILIVVLILIMYVTYRFARHQYYNNVNYQLNNSNVDYIYMVQITNGLMVSEDAGQTDKIKVEDIIAIYQSKNITVVSDSYNNVIFTNEDFQKVVEQYPILEEVPITKVKGQRTRRKPKTIKENKG